MRSAQGKQVKIRSTLGRLHSSKITRQALHRLQQPTWPAYCTVQYVHNRNQWPSSLMSWGGQENTSRTLFPFVLFQEKQKLQRKEGRRACIRGIRASQVVSPAHSLHVGKVTPRLTNTHFHAATDSPSHFRWMFSVLRLCPYSHLFIGYTPFNVDIPSFLAKTFATDTKLCIPLRLAASYTLSFLDFAH